MNGKTVIFLLIFICILLALTSGCWDYKEIVDKIIVAGAAIDYDRENNGIILTVEIALPMPSDKESTFTSQIYQGKGKSIRDAAKNLTSKAGHELLWSHSKVFIFSEDLLEKEDLFTGIMDWMKRDLETRDYIWLLLSKEKTAGEIFLKSEPQTEKIISFYLDHLFLTIDSNETYLKVPYWRFMNDLLSESASAALPTVHLENSSTGTIPLLYGTEILEGAKPVCWLDSDQTKIFLLLTNKLENVIFILEFPHNEKSQRISLKMISGKTSIKPVLHGKYLAMEVHVQMEANIGEIDGDKDVFMPEDIKNLEKAAQNMIIDKINGEINLFKEKYKIDAIGFGNKVDDKYPKLWKQIKNDWKNEFSQIPSDIQMELKITGSVQSMKITKVGQ